MFNISDIDKNLRVEHRLSDDVRATLEFYDVEQAPFSIYGVFREGDSFVRMPKAVAHDVSGDVEALNCHTAGGRIRFTTDSKRIAVVTACQNNKGMGHIALAGVCGFDIYADYNGIRRYYGTCVPPVGFKDGFESIVAFPDASNRTVTVNMPLYNGVYKVYIGVDKGSTVKSAEPLIQQPVVYYGSSITQGGCASRPGNAYQAIIHSKLKTDFINLGFSGSAKGEAAMMNYIAGLDMSAFIYDYDHNAPTAEHLAATHQSGYKTVRNSHPLIPIIMMTRPQFYPTKEEIERKRIVYKTYCEAVANGDDNVYFVDGSDLIGSDVAEHALVDNCHPTDLGFYFMAKKLFPIISSLVK